MLCGVRKGGETVVPFPAEEIPDLVEGDGPLLPNEIPCGRVVEVNRLSRQHCRRHGVEMFRALRVARRSAIKINGSETNHSGKPLPRGTYRERSFSGPSVACLWRPLEGVFSVPEVVPESMSPYSLDVDGYRNSLPLEQHRLLYPGEGSTRQTGRQSIDFYVDTREFSSP